MANCYNESQIPQLKDRTIFFDANILIYLFAPTGRTSFENKYASMFRELLTAQYKIAVDVTVISEFINRAIKTGYDIYCSSNNLDKSQFRYKSDYRDSTDGSQAIRSIYDMVNNKIMKNFKLIGKSFTVPDVKSMLCIDGLDFNDKVIELICRENNFVLLTNDGDFINADLDILSANKKFIDGRLLS